LAGRKALLLGGGGGGGLHVGGDAGELGLGGDDVGALVGQHLFAELREQGGELLVVGRELLLLLGFRLAPRRTIDS
jgi:hypothetical protein